MRKYFSLLLFVIFYLAFAVSTAFAQAPVRYYDWSSTFETKPSENVLGVKSFAQESTTSAAAQASLPLDYKKFDSYFLLGDLTPANPLYFLKTFEENIQLVLTFDPASKAEKRIAIAGEKLDEMQDLIDDNKPSAIAVSAQRYNDLMNQVTENLKTLRDQRKIFPDVLKQVEAATAKHNIVLERVFIQVPAQAKPALENAKQASWKGTDVAADLAGKPAVPPDVVDRLQALKAQGLLTGEEVNKLISVKSREEARTEMGKYVKEGIFPEADFLRLNENTKTLYPQEFFKMHEVKRFYELKRLESEKPDDATLAKIQEFAKVYNSGDVVPSDIRRWWAPVIRLEEIQNTLRPDLIDSSLIKNNKNDYDKFTEVVERFKPRPEDFAFIQNYMDKNKADVTSLPPEYQRMYYIAQEFGGQCGKGYHWVPLPQTGGMCAPDGSDGKGAGGDFKFEDLQKIEDFARGKTCSGTITAAKGPGGACSAYPSDCIPSGWSKASTCVENPEIEVVGQRNPDTPKRLTCPQNSHWAVVSFSPEGGYCVPNYTPSASSLVSASEAACPSGYHKNYAGGPCLQDYNTPGATYSLPPLTSTPGNYPSPVYNTRCGTGSHWVSEPTGGGYCAPDNYNPSYIPYGSPLPGTFNSTIPLPSIPVPGATGGGTSGGYTISGSGGTSTTLPPSGYGQCPAGMYWNGSYCASSTSGGGSQSGSYSGGMSRDSQESACRSGGGTCSWNGDVCNCQSYQSSSTSTNSGPYPTPSSGNYNNYYPTYTSPPATSYPAPSFQESPSTPPPSSSIPSPSTPSPSASSSTPPPSSPTP